MGREEKEMTAHTERAFREADSAARLLGDMKHGVYELKSAGGIGERESMEALWGFTDQATDIIENLRETRKEAIHEIERRVDSENRERS